jgi:uncharacterized protein
MNRITIIDAGPLVALIHRDDQYHSWAYAQAQQLSPPFLTCEAALSEAYFLLAGVPAAQQGLNALLRQGWLQVRFELANEIDSVTKLLDRYTNVPMSLADACLVRMSELTTDCAIFTVDSDFNIYRRHRNQIIPVITPTS